MPRPEFFRSVGLFILDAFLQPAQCARLRTEMWRAPSQQGLVFGNTPEGVVDKSIRQVLRTKVEGSAEQFVKECLERQRPSFEEHFGIFLQPGPSTEFLTYNSGGFYIPHTDAGRTNESHHRRVSIVIFLNEESDEPKPNCYGGGKLTFHGILNDGEWVNCAFPIDSHPGLLVAFRPDVVHEVTPVTFGQRFTIVSWFFAAAIPKEKTTFSSRGAEKEAELQNCK